MEVSARLQDALNGEGAIKAKVERKASFLEGKKNPREEFVRKTRKTSQNRNPALHKDNPRRVMEENKGPRFTRQGYTRATNSPWDFDPSPLTVTARRLAYQFLTLTICGLQRGMGNEVEVDEP